MRNLKRDRWRERLRGEERNRKVKRRTKSGEERDREVKRETDR